MSDKVLVTGADGFIGSKICELLYLSGNHVIGLGISNNKPDYMHKYLCASICDYSILSKIIDNDIKVIYHFAASTNVNESIINPDNDLNINLIGTYNILKLTRKMRLKAFIFPSSVSVLQNGIQYQYDELARYGPNTPYGASKMAGEGYCNAFYKSYNVPIKIVRLFNVYGPGRLNMVVPDLIFKLLNNSNEIVIRGNGEQIRDFIYVDDAAKGIIMVAEKGEIGGIYNVASGEPTSINELVKDLINILNVSKINIRYTDLSYGTENTNWYANIEKIQEIGFKNQTSLYLGLKKTIEWAQSYGRR